MLTSGKLSAGKISFKPINNFTFFSGYPFNLSKPIIYQFGQNCAPMKEQLTYQKLLENLSWILSTNSILLYSHFCPLSVPWLERPSPSVVLNLPLPYSPVIIPLLTSTFDVLLRFCHCGVLPYCSELLQTYSCLLTDYLLIFWWLLHMNS